MKFSTITNIGKLREINQDSYSNISVENYDFFIVADGMGGHSEGEVASDLASSSFVEYIKNANLSEYDNIIDLLEESIFYANDRVCQLADEKKEKMGTTVICLCIDYKKKMFHISHIGDSRIYLYRDDMLTQLTKDHSLVNELIDRGALKEDEAQTFINRNAVTRAVGINPNTRPDTKSLEMLTGDVILMVTDGLTNELSTEAIRDIIVSNEDAYDISMKLVDAAIEAGGRDNITVTTIKI